MGLSGASERSSSESESGALDEGFEVAGDVKTCSDACVLGIAEEVRLEVEVEIVGRAVCVVVGIFSGPL